MIYRLSSALERNKKRITELEDMSTEMFSTKMQTELRKNEKKIQKQNKVSTLKGVIYT